MFDKHVLPRVGGPALRDVSTVVVASLAAELQAADAGPAATRKALTVLQGIFSCAVAWGHVRSNPVAGVRKPSAKRERAIDPLSLAVVERMRAQLLGDGRLRDVTLLAVLAYAGLRPQEALAAWRLASGRPTGDELVFPTAAGGLWRDHDWANWRRRVFDPLATSLGVRGMRPYDLRHAFCSLLIAEGLSVVEVARQAGHSPTMTLDTYAHVMADLEGGERAPAEAAIRAARDGEVSASGDSAGQ